MTKHSADQAMLEKIAQAYVFDGQPDHKASLPFESLGRLLNAQAACSPDQDILNYCRRSSFSAARFLLRPRENTAGAS